MGWRENATKSLKKDIVKVKIFVIQCSNYCQVFSKGDLKVVDTGLLTLGF